MTKPEDFDDGFAEKPRHPTTGRKRARKPGTSKTKPAHLPPAIARSEAMAKVRAAAEAVGLSVQELADIMVDGGITAMPPDDGITHTYSLEDMGRRLWGEMQTRPRSRRCEWFNGLAENQRGAVIVVLRDRGFATETIAKEFQIDATTVMKFWNAYADKVGDQVVGLRLNTIAGQMQMASERAQQMASDANDHRGYWAIEKERLAALQSLGIVQQAVHRSEVTHKFDGQAVAEIEKLAELKRKQMARSEEMKRIEAEVVDEVPATLSFEESMEEDR